MRRLMQRVDALETRAPSMMRLGHAVPLSRDRHVSPLVPSYLSRVSRVQHPALRPGLLVQSPGPVYNHVSPAPVYNHVSPAPVYNHVDEQLQQTKQWLKNRTMNLN